MTAVGAAQSWPFCLGIGISAIVLGALTATGLCVDEFCCSDSNPEEVPPGVTLGSPLSFTSLIAKSARCF